MKKNIITMLLLVAATTLYAQDKLVLIDSASIAVRKRSSELSFHDQEMQRMLMPKDAEFGVECVPSFEPEWMLTYSPSAHALLMKRNPFFRTFLGSTFDSRLLYTHPSSPYDLCTTGL